MEVDEGQTTSGVRQSAKEAIPGGDGDVEKREDNKKRAEHEEHSVNVCIWLFDCDI